MKNIMDGLKYSINPFIYCTSIQFQGWIVISKKIILNEAL